VSLIADLVVSSAAAAFAHFGVTLDIPEREPPRAERTVARTQARKPQPAVTRSVEDCPDKQPAVLRI
jgi:hypothetical protein